jgi:hypothetical protein
MLVGAGNATIGTFSSTGLALGNGLKLTLPQIQAPLVFGDAGTGSTARRAWAIANSIEVMGGLSFKVASAVDSDPLAGSTAMTLHYSGNLGLGVTPSAWSASVKSIEIQRGCGIWGTNTTQTIIGANMILTSGGYVYGNNGSANMLQVSAGAYHFYTAPSGTAGNTITWTTAMTLDTSGVLDLNANAASGYAIDITNASATSPLGQIIRLTGVTGGSGSGFFECFDNAMRFKIAGNGNATNVNNSYGAISDLKLKENVTDCTPKLDKLNQVRIVNFNLKTDPNHKQLGVIAQELEQIFPGMVEESIDRDKTGNDLGTTTKSVKYSVFVPMLVKAIQELSAKNDALEARLTQLELYQSEGTK